MIAPTMSLRASLDDPLLLGTALQGDSWATWRTVMLAAMGEPLTADELAIFKQVTARNEAPMQRIDEVWCVIGRRGGKDRAASVIATFLAAFTDWSAVLARGERGIVLCIGADQSQARITRNYVEAVFDASPLLSRLVVNRTADAIELSNRIAIEVRAASFRRLRGVTAVAVIASEAAFWLNEESQNPDAEILNAVRPALATTGGPLIVITSPYARRGETWETYRRHYGPAGDPRILVVRGSSREFNPTLSPTVVARALERDPAAASAEYLGEFRNDLEALVDRAIVERCVSPGVYERPFVRGVQYAAFCDPSGGMRDSFAVSIGHVEGHTVVLDVIREIRPPFDPAQAVAEVAAVLKQFRVFTAASDKYAAQWPVAEFQTHGITLKQSAQPKSILYLNMLPALNAGRVSLLDHPTTVNQICALERRTGRGSGRDVVDHAPHGRDDCANAVAGVIGSLLGAGHDTWDWVDDSDSDPATQAALDAQWRRQTYWRGILFQ